jgi:DNA replication ATP-dependent helicase Dna2
LSPTKLRVLTSKQSAGGGGKDLGVGKDKNKENRPFLAAGSGMSAGAKTTGRKIEPKKVARIGERAILRGKPVLRDILNDMMDGGY